MKFLIVKGSTSVILHVFIQDSSATDGSGLGSLDENSSIVGGYVKRNGLGIALAVDENVTTEGTYEAPTTAAQVRIGTPANQRTGVYELHFHNDLFTTADWVTITLGGATDMAELPLEVQLTSVDFNDAVRGGMSEIAAILANVTGIAGAAMRGTDGASTHSAADVWAVAARILTAATNITAGGGTTVEQTGDSFARIGATGSGLTSLAQASIATEARLAELDAANLPSDIDAILDDTSTSGVLVAVGGIGATAFAANAINAAALAQDAAREIADEILDRNLAGGGSGDTRNVRNALRPSRNRVAIVAGTATVFEEDDATTAWTAAITTAAGDPISEVNPAGP